MARRPEEKPQGESKITPVPPAAKPGRWSARGIFDATIRQRWSANPWLSAVSWLWYCLGFVLFYFSEWGVETADTGWGLVALSFAVLAALLVGLSIFAYSFRADLKLRIEDAGYAMVGAFAVWFAIYGYLDFANYVGSTGPVVVYQGPVLHKRLDPRLRTSTTRARSLGDAVDSMIVNMLFAPLNRDDYYLTVMDGSTNQEVELKVPKFIYESLGIGAHYSQTMLPGLLGIPCALRNDSIAADIRHAVDENCSVQINAKTPEACRRMALDQGRDPCPVWQADFQACLADTCGARTSGEQLVDIHRTGDKAKMAAAYEAIVLPILRNDDKCGEPGGGRYISVGNSVMRDIFLAWKETQGQ
ncbi:MAG TPA: hypothetical protein VI279_06470 [Rhodocyclaceae bacterium]